MYIAPYPKNHVINLLETLKLFTVNMFFFFRTEASAAQRGLQEELSEAEKALARAEVEKVGKPMEAQGRMVRMVSATKNIRLGCKWKGVEYVTILYQICGKTKTS